MSLVSLGIEKSLKLLRSRELDLAKPSCLLAPSLVQLMRNVPSLWGFLFNKEG
jgi:hypothetical protein